MRVGRLGRGRERPERRSTLDALRHIEEDAALPEGSVQRLELAEVDRHRLGHEVLLEQLLMLAGGGVEIAVKMTPLAASVRIDLGPDSRGIRLHEDAGLGRVDRRRRCSRTRRAAPRATAPCRRFGEKGCRLPSLRRAEIGAAPFLVGAGRHRERFVGVPRAQARIAQPGGLVFHFRKRHDRVAAESGLMCQCCGHMSPQGRPELSSRRREQPIGAVTDDSCRPASYPTDPSISS